MLERPAVGTYLTFGPAAWSHNDSKIACFYLLSSGIEEDLERKVLLLGVDLAGGKPKETAIIGQPVVCNSAIHDLIRWSPDDARLQFYLADAPLIRGGEDRPFVVGYDGKGLAPMSATIFLRGSQYTVEGLKYASDEQVGVYHATGIRKDVRTGRSEPLKFDSPIKATFSAWSVNGEHMAYGVIVPRDGAYKNLQASFTRVYVVDTRTGMKIDLGEIKGAVGSDQVFWLEP